MATLAKGYSFGATEEVTAAKLHTLIDSGTVTSIVAADITDGVITDAKMDSVGGNKFTGLANIAGGAGSIPAANLTLAALLAGNQTIAGVKTFSSFPVTPSSAPTTDYQVGNKKYTDDRETSILAAATFKGIEDYGTSASASTSKNQADVYICYGQFAVTGTQAITNLPFTSATSYVVTLAQRDNFNQAPMVTKNSGSQFTITENATGNQTIEWCAIGT